MNPIPVAKPFLGKEEDWAVAEVLQSGNLTTGWKVQEFEEMFADYLGVKFAIACNSATSGLQIAWEVEKERAKDRIETIPFASCPSYSFIATANVLVSQSIFPSLEDIELETYNLKPPADIFKLQDGHRMGFMPVHQMGLIYPQDDIQRAVDDKALVVEDAACAVGSWFKYGTRVMSHMAVFSFHPRKVITTGEGGMIVTDHHKKACRAEELISHAPGSYNYRMTDIQAAMGLEQLKKLLVIIEKRQELAVYYDTAFANEDEIITPMSSPNRQSYQIRLDPGGWGHRDIILEKLHEVGVMATKGVQAIHLDPYYEKVYKKYDLPNSETAAASSIIMPLFPGMTKEQVMYCAETLIEAVRAYREKE